MKLFAIGDLHLGFAVDKPMDLFDPIWKDHHAKVKADWYEKVSQDDLVLIVGDTSWAMYFEDALIDLEWIDGLPGNKLLIKGNHDYWWQSLSKMQCFESIFFIHNNYYKAGNLAVCGTRGWILPGNEEFRPEDEKIYIREKLRLERSIELAKKDPEIESIVVGIHYPPLFRYQTETLFNDVLRDPMIKHVVYGHLHDEESWEKAVKGNFEDKNFHLVSADYLDFTLKEIPLETSR